MLRVAAKGAKAMEFPLKLMRLLHMVLGITPAEPKQERVYLLLWTGSFVLILVIVIASVVFLLPRVMR
jgi:hypothetical protein